MSKFNFNKFILFLILNLFHINIYFDINTMPPNPSSTPPNPSPILPQSVIIPGLFPNSVHIVPGTSFTVSFDSIPNGALGHLNLSPNLILVGPNNFGFFYSITNETTKITTPKITYSGSYNLLALYDTEIIFVSTIFYKSSIITIDFPASPSNAYVIAGTSAIFTITYDLTASYINSSDRATSFTFTYPNGTVSDTIEIMPNSFIFTTNPITPLSTGTGKALFTFYNGSYEQIGSPQTVNINIFGASPINAYIFPNTSVNFTITNAQAAGVTSFKFTYPDGTEFSSSIESYLENTGHSDRNNFTFTTGPITSSNIGPASFTFYNSYGLQIGASQNVTINFPVSPTTAYVITNTSATFTITNAQSAGAKSFTFTYPDGTTFSDSITSYLESTRQTDPNNFTFTTGSITTSGTANFTFYNNSTVQDSSTQIGSPQDVTINFPVSPTNQYVITNTPATFTITNAQSAGAESFIFTYPDGTKGSAHDITSNLQTYITSKPIPQSGIGKFTFYSSGSQIGSQDVNIITFDPISSKSAYTTSGEPILFNIVYPEDTKSVTLIGPNYPIRQMEITSDTPNPFIFSLNNIKSSGEYKFIFHNHSGIAIDSKTINIQYSPFTVELEPLVQSLQLGETLILKAPVEGGRSPYTYSWTKPDGSIVKTASDIFYKSNIQLTDSGTYFVIVTDSSGKSITSKSALVLVN